MLDHDHAPSEDVLGALPIFPLPNAVLMPGMVLPLNVFEPRYLELVDHVLRGSRVLGVPLLRPGFEADYEGRPAIEPVFGVGRLVSHQRLPDGRRFIRLEGTRRVRAVRELPARASFRELEVELLPELPPRDEYQFEVFKAQLERIAITLRLDDQQLLESVLSIPARHGLVYAVAAILPTLGLAREQIRDGRSSLLSLQQRCLEAATADERIAQLLAAAAEICDCLRDGARFLN